MAWLQGSVVQPAENAFQQGFVQPLQGAWSQSQQALAKGWDESAQFVGAAWSETERAYDWAAGGVKNILANTVGQAFPEVAWTQFTTAQRDTLLNNLDNYGVEGSKAAAYVRQEDTQFGFIPQANSGAGWTLMGNITLPPGADINDSRNVAVIIHEELHLEQPLTTRLSVDGELRAWQLEYKAYHDKTGQYYGAPTTPFYDQNSPQKEADAWKDLSQLNPDSRVDLAKAQKLMKVVSSNYRSDQLPLQPIEQEISYDVGQAVDNALQKVADAGKQALDQIRKLIKLP